MYFYDPRCGRCRRVEGYLASILQNRQNHDTFLLARVSSAERPDLVDHFRVERFPTVVVVEGGKQFARLEEPSAVAELQLFLARWLR